MTFETLNDNVMLIELSREEMEKLHITYESLNDSNEETQVALKTLLSKIDTEKRLSKDEKVLVEAMPTENGGCFFILTFTYRNKIEKIINVFSTENERRFVSFYFISFFLSVCKCEDKKATAIFCWHCFYKDLFIL